MLFLILFTGSIPVTSAFCQEKKNEQKIKIVIVDESGNKTIIDTTFTGESVPKTLTLKDGKVIVIGKPGTDMLLKKLPAGKEEVFVTVTSDDEGEKRKEEKITIMSSDSVQWTAASAGEKGNVYVYSKAKGSGGKPGSKVIISSDGDKNIDLEGENVVIVKDGKLIKKNGEKSFSVYVESDENDSITDITRYVIAKDGLVITVEGKDEAKTQELIKMIESKLDVKGEQEGNKEAVKTETKKAIKK
jgi:hypothetical protein